MRRMVYRNGTWSVNIDSNEDNEDNEDVIDDVIDEINTRDGQVLDTINEINDNS